MKEIRINVYIIIVLIVMSIIMMVINDLFVNNNDIDNLIIGIFSGEIVSLIHTVFIYILLYKKEYENKIINSLILHYSDMACINFITSKFDTFTIIRDETAKKELKQLIINLINSKVSYEEPLCGLFKDGKKIRYYNYAYNFSRERSPINDLKLQLEINEYEKGSIDELFDECCKITEERMNKIDDIFNILNEKYDLKLNWNQYKKENCIGYCKI